MVSTKSKSIILIKYFNTLFSVICPRKKNRRQPDAECNFRGRCEKLDEVVVVGYSVQKKKDITGAVSTVLAKDIENIPVNDFGSALAGRSAGVQVITPSGKPNEGFSIRVRGATSINAGNEPLYVVDGVPTSDTKTINPSEIESITVLKDASSAAIYGNAGANGVVLITTKRGRKGEAQIELNAYYGFRNVPRE